MIYKQRILWIAFILLLLNVLAIDVGVVVADKALREVRDAACDSFDISRTAIKQSAPKRTPGDGQYGIYIEPQSAGEFMLMELSITVPRTYNYQPDAEIGPPPMKFVRETELRLYGCDANGNRYRFWKSGIIR